MLERLVELECPRAYPEEIREEQLRPRVPLLSGGKDPALAERFEEGLHDSLLEVRDIQAVVDPPILS